jgi:nucleotide-binding universal stress UspA family protein
MYKHILIPTDGSELSNRAVRQGIDLARTIGARVTVVNVSPTFHTLSADPFMATSTPEQFRRECQAEAERFLAAAAAAASTAGVVCETVHLEDNRPYQAIIDTATKKDCDLIFMASHGRKGVAALVLGSETNKVLTHSKIPVLVCR